MGWRDWTIELIIGRYKKDRKEAWFCEDARTNTEPQVSEGREDCIYRMNILSEDARTNTEPQFGTSLKY